MVNSLLGGTYFLHLLAKKSRKAKRFGILLANYDGTIVSGSMLFYLFIFIS